MALTVSAADAAVEGDDVVGLRQSTAMIVATTWVSQRKPSSNDGPQRTVDEAGGQRRLLGGASLTTEERAGDLADGVHPLFDVDGEREEVDSLAHGLVGGCGDQHLGVPQARR